MKNQSIQNMVRNQKLDAERRKEMVSYKIMILVYLSNTFYINIGTTRKTAWTT